VRAKQQSSNALGMYSSTESSFSTAPDYATDFDLSIQVSHPPHPTPPAVIAAPVLSEPTPGVADGDGLLHDARNLIGTLGLYCDLLSVPGVLQPQHRQYAEDLRLVGSRSGALIERLFEQLGSREAEAARAHPARRAMDPGSPAWLAAPARQAVLPEFTLKRVSLRKIVERCHGLLNRVSGGVIVEVSYGEAAALPVRVVEDAIERILVNLVRNAATALCDPATLATGHPRTIRVGVGELGNGIGEPRPWPFRQVRLMVEDSGCGMTPSQVDQLLSGLVPPSVDTHGIGFKVVRELVAASHGELRMMSAPGVGTRVQIEWPIAPVSLTQTPEFRRDPAQAPGDAGRLAPVRVPSAIPSGTGIGAQSGNTKSLGATKERWLSC
jgi:signal transduction histidine kinase